MIRVDYYTVVMTSDTPDEKLMSMTYSKFENYTRVLFGVSYENIEGPSEILTPHKSNKDEPKCAAVKRSSDPALVLNTLSRDQP